MGVFWGSPGLSAQTPSYYWSMDDNSVTNSSSFSTTGRVWQRPGKIGSAYSLESHPQEPKIKTISVIQSNNIGLATSKTYSFSCWINTGIYPEFYPDGSEAVRATENFIISKRGQNKQLDLVLKTGGILAFRSWYNNSTYDELAATDNIPVNRWVHVTVTVDNSSKIATLYVNGIPVGTKQLSGSTMGDGSSSKLFFGNCNSNLTSAGEDIMQFNGSIDEVKWYNDVVLTADSVMAESSVNIKPDHQWKFNEGPNSYDTQMDFMGSVNITIAGCEFVPGKSGASSVKLSKNSDYMITKDKISLGVNHSYSISTWINPSANVGIILKKAYQGTNQFTIKMESSGKVSAKVYSDNAQEIQLETGNIPQNEWTLVTLTVDNKNKISKLYKNGHEDDAVSFSFVPAIDNDFLLIGNDGATAFNGMLDDVSIYKNKVLSQTDIQKLVDRTELDQTVYAPVYYENYCQSEARLYDYEPNFIAGETTFDSKNRPYIRFDKYVQTLDENGKWIRHDLVAAVKEQYPSWNGIFSTSEQFDNRVIFDADDWAYTYLFTSGTAGSNAPFDNGDVILYSTDYCATWKVLILPGPAWFPNWENVGANDLLTNPPCLLARKGYTWDTSSSNNEMFLHFFRKEGTTLTLDKKLSIWPKAIGSVGHSGHGRSIVSNGNLVHVCFGGVSPVDGTTGTPFYAMTIDRTNYSIVTSPTYIASIADEIDNHNYPSIDMDSEGYLHLVMTGHHHEMKYVKSLNPNSTASWETVKTVSQASGHTYNSFVIDYDDTQHVTSRYSGYGYVFSVSHLSKAKDDDNWSTIERIMSPRKGNYHVHNNKLSMDRNGNLYQTYSYHRDFILSAAEVLSYKHEFPWVDIHSTKTPAENQTTDIVNSPYFQPAIMMLPRGETKWRLATTEDFKANITDLPNAVENLLPDNSKKFFIYPTIAENQITISPANENFTWSICTLVGVKVKTGTGSHVDVSFLKSGVYLLCVGDAVEKFIKK